MTGLQQFVIALSERTWLSPVAADEMNKRDRWLADALKSVFDFEAHLHRQREWSGATFGPGARTHGVIQHIRKELNEIEADPSDITEWIDVVILGLDGAWRAGFTPEQIIAALQEKQAINEKRQWPDWRLMSDTSAIEHVR